MEISVIIPTLNAAGTIRGLLDALRKQTTPPDEVIVVDSASEDDTVEIAAAAGAICLRVARKDFDHGGTRDAALQESTGDVVVFMTQDAMPADAQALERLVAPFDDPRVAAVGGRQTAQADARLDEKLVRAYNYPAESRVWERADTARLGVRAYLISDVFAAYRREAYRAAGGFDSPIMTNEDMLMAQKLLEAGYALAYAGDAVVLHSHNLTLRQQYRRNYLVGRTMERYAARFAHAKELGEGVKLAKFALGTLLRQGHVVQAARFALDCAARLLGNRMGRLDEARGRTQDA